MKMKNITCKNKFVVRFEITLQMSLSIDVTRPLIKYVKTIYDGFLFSAVIRILRPNVNNAPEIKDKRILPQKPKYAYPTRLKRGLGPVIELVTL